MLRGAYYYYYFEYRWLNKTHTQGVVVDLKAAPGNSTIYKSDAKYAPVLEYKVNGKLYRNTAGTYFKGSYIYRKLHKKVIVYYDPDNPNDVVMKGEFNAIIFVSMIVGGLLVLYSFIYSVFYPKKYNQMSKENAVNFR